MGIASSHQRKRIKRRMPGRLCSATYFICSDRRSNFAGRSHFLALLSRWTIRSRARAILSTASAIRNAIQTRCFVASGFEWHDGFRRFFQQSSYSNDCHPAEISSPSMRSAYGRGPRPADLPLVVIGVDGPV
jgi:hypothetical protein